MNMEAPLGPTEIQMELTSLVHISDVELHPDHSRVVTHLFVPGHEGVGPGESRARIVIERILALPEADIQSTLAEITERFSDRHRDIEAIFDTFACDVIRRLPTGTEPEGLRRRFMGACFTHEYSIEGASLCNPSIVAHPHQDTDNLEFIMSVRGIGEGHRSSIGFRTGRITPDGTVIIDAADPFPVIGQKGTAERERTRETIDDDDKFGEPRYSLRFPETTSISERVLWPQLHQEQSGMEDARFVRFEDDGADPIYFATYTAFDGVNIAQFITETRDFQSFSMRAIRGSAARGKGLAIFPRKINGQYVALSRADRESNSIAFSDDLYLWEDSTVLQLPLEAWEVLQLGNCGSPIETPGGWLVLTHGVGPMRTYSIGAILLDLDDPRHVIGRTTQPIIIPTADRRNGYVPNVVYTCGALAHDDLLVIPFAVADQWISIATLSISALTAKMVVGAPDRRKGDRRSPPIVDRAPAVGAIVSSATVEPVLEVDPVSSTPAPVEPIEPIPTEPITPTPTEPAVPTPADPPANPVILAN